MARSLPAGDERGLEREIGMLLRAGLALAALLVSAGASLYLLRHGAELPDYRVFHGEPAALRSPTGILGGALALSGRSLIELGLLVLLATPVARVALSLVVFARQRDWLYVATTSLVLVVLLYSILAGARA